MGISNADLTGYPWQDAVTLQYPAAPLNPKADKNRFQVVSKNEMRMNQKL